MPLTFLNGGAPLYKGQIFNTSSQLLTTIKDTLVTAGWTFITENSGVSLLMRGNSLNDHKCFVRFAVTTSSNITDGRLLTVRGFQAEDLLVGSPDNYYQFIYREGGRNRIWITADDDAACLSIFSESNSMQGMHFGFLERIDPTDPNAWMVGWVHSWGHLYAHVCRSRQDNVSWRNLSAVYFQLPSLTQDSNTTYPHSTFDATRRGKSLTHWNTNSNSNPFFAPADGANNYTGLSLIDRYAYIEGRSSTTDYATAQIALNFRGYVKYACCGVSQHEGGRVTYNTFTNEVVMSTGGNQWQGMRVA